MNRYAYSMLLGTGACLAQLWLVAQPQLSRLTPKATALVQEALVNGRSAGLIAIVSAYLAIAVTTHVAPLLLTAKVHGDLLARGPARLRRLLAKPGSLTLSLAGALMLLVIANHALFPLSLAVPHGDLLLVQQASPLLVFGLPALYLATGMYWLARLASRRVKAGAIAMSVVALAAWAAPTGGTAAHRPLDRRPDLIVIGVDSLRPDHLASFGFSGASQTPAIDRFVSQSVRFERAYTPQGRTFVAYMSILSGQYPTRHRVRENLYPRALFDKEVSVSHRLQQRGYATVFAIDEARFANFDQGFGFDAVVSPPPGTADFVVGAFMDTVGTNLLQLAPYAGALLPHVAGNRAAASIYRPSVHSDTLGRAVAAVDSAKPLFLAAHFCIAHSPYAPGQPRLPAPPAPFSDSPTKYRSALAIADHQVARLLADLRAKGRLENAIVVLLSDHGEALAMDKDRWQLTDAAGDVTNPNHYGHGFPTLDEAQSRVLLSMQRFRDGEAVWPRQSVPDAVSLVDVVPTLLGVARLPYAPGDFDGLAILDPDGTPTAPAHRPLFVESGINGVSLQQPEVDPGAVANEFNYIHRITDDQRFELNARQLPEQLRNKQRAMVLGRFGLSSSPEPLKNGEGCWLRVDLKTRQAKCLPLDTLDPVVTAYQPLLCRHFATDAAFFRQWCLRPANSAPTATRTEAAGAG